MGEAVLGQVNTSVVCVSLVKLCVAVENCIIAVFVL